MCSAVKIKKREHLKYLRIVLRIYYIMFVRKNTNVTVPVVLLGLHRCMGSYIAFWVALIIFAAAALAKV